MNRAFPRKTAQTRKRARQVALTASLLSLCACQTPGHDDLPASGGSATKAIPTTMDLGVSSISLTVEDIAVSSAFYRKLGFEQINGNMDDNWLILRNGQTVIGLFQGVFERNIITFNPGWAASLDHPDEFTDIRDLEERMVAAGIEPVMPITDEARSATGPASLMLVDPDGNPILIDQHR